VWIGEKSGLQETEEKTDQTSHNHQTLETLFGYERRKSIGRKMPKSGL
jgi:hypothetical protein